MNRNIKLVTIVFTLFMFSVATFQISHALGIMAPDADSSRFIFMFNLANIPIAIFLCHWFLLLSQRTNLTFNRIMIPAVYITGIVMFVYFLIFPETFLLPSVPKLYFPFYYNPGEYQIIMRIWFNVVGLYYFYELYKAYVGTDDVIAKNRYRYVLLSIIFGFITASTAILLVFNIQFDPFYASFFGLFTLPLVYTMIKYELLDIKVIAKQATLYSFFVTLLFLVLTTLIGLNQYIVVKNPFIPQWFVPLIVSILVCVTGVLLWKQIRKTDILKYEFINIISHKFRTPLTYVKWELDSILKEEVLSDKLKERLVSISGRNNHLIELTATLVTLSEFDDFGKVSAREVFEFDSVIKGLVNKFEDVAKRKNIKLTATFEGTGLPVFAEKNKIEFVVYSLINNSITFTPTGGSIDIIVKKVLGNVLFEIKDSGIGFDAVERSYIFSNFHRSLRAQSSDTEGLGINLYMSQQIVEKSGGKIDAISDGIGKGSKFSFTLPIYSK